tara:strand:+ start:2601 stop:3008 length:408 start_codon:yes stop_codon:yes gene_type:complete
MTCPPGYIEVGGECVPSGLSKERFDRVQTPSVSSKINVNRDLPKLEDPYGELKKFGSMIRDAWDNRPDSPAWAKSFTPAKGAIEGAEELISLQFRAGEKIASGDLAGAEQYSQVERERVESLGFKPTWSPGGLQV